MLRRQWMVYLKNKQKNPGDQGKRLIVICETVNCSSSSSFTVIEQNSKSDEETLNLSMNQSINLSETQEEVHKLRLTWRIYSVISIHYTTVMLSSDGVSTSFILHTCLHAAIYIHTYPYPSHHFTMLTQLTNLAHAIYTHTMPL